MRTALGTDRGSVVLTVLREAFWQGGYLIASHLFGIRPWEPLMLSFAKLLLTVAALIAAGIPARRATLVEAYGRVALRIILLR